MRVPTGRYSDDRLKGRKEQRLPIMVVVNLAPQVPENAEKHERTYTDNISAHGARVHSTYAWQLGEQAEITPANGETPVRGEVVYCQRFDNGRFFVGLKLPRNRIPWSILQRFDGMNWRVSVAVIFSIPPNAVYSNAKLTGGQLRVFTWFEPAQHRGKVTSHFLWGDTVNLLQSTVHAVGLELYATGHSYNLTFRCIKCGRYEASANYRSDRNESEDQVKARIYPVRCSGCGWQGEACGLSVIRILRCKSYGPMHAGRAVAEDCGCWETAGDVWPPADLFPGFFGGCVIDDKEVVMLSRA